MNNVAIAHDQFRTYGGAERVAAEIARIYDAPIYAMRVDQDVVPDDVEVRCLAGDLGEWVMRRHYLAQDAYQMLAWPHVPELHEYNTIIQTKNNPMWYVPSLDHQTVLRYCHSTPRSLYDMYDHHGGSVVGDVVKLAMRTLYQQTTPYADRWLCNSEVVQRRLQGYLAPTAPTQVVYPPVSVGETGPDHAPTQDYLFVVGRLGINKRIELVREVAATTGRRVVVAGDGPERETLLNGAPANLDYLGYIDDEEKYRRLSEAGATLFLARHEDFGIVPIESFAAGTPVVGVDEGFTQHQIVTGHNGVLVKPDVDSVMAGIQQVGDVQWSPAQIAAYAEQFGTDRFRNEVISAVAAAKRDAAVEPKIEQPEPQEVSR